MLSRQMAIRFTKRLLDSDWTPQEVAVWLYQHGLPRQKYVFIVEQAVRENAEELEGPNNVR